MAKYQTHNIRNMALLGHAGSGKTTLTEALLFASGEIAKCGQVEKGNTLSDYDETEIKLQHSIDCSICSFSKNESHVNLIDTPGYPDFYNRALSVLPAVETAAIVINAQNGIELISQRAMKSVQERNLCCLIIVNKIDANDCNVEQLLSQLQEHFAKSACR